MPSVIEVKWCRQQQPAAVGSWALQQPLCSSSGWAEGMRKWWGPLFGFCFWDYRLGSSEISLGI